MGRKSLKPVIGLPACRHRIGHHWFHAAGEKYLAAVAEGAGANPVVIPLGLAGDDLVDLIGRLDGVLLTGSLSNVEPQRYGGAESRAGTLHDPARDEVTLPLVRAALDEGLPLLAICRGFQEFNVALGGTLHPHVQEVQGMNDHREKPDTPLDEKYGPAHEINLVAGGVLHGLAASERVTVNSLHEQGVARLAPGLTVEAVADDGLVEAFRADGAQALALAVQWHPEWRFRDSPLSRALFAHLGQASREHAARR